MLKTYLFVRKQCKMTQKQENKLQNNQITLFWFKS